mmetsp:Transcript_26957/g.93565  ORF Transcript_26957/g.93565 Transcript_26957/m.93565 type:complete len:233 (+) Transcript_26957:523-1221(+)
MPSSSGSAPLRLTMTTLPSSGAELSTVMPVLTTCDDSPTRLYACTVTYMVSPSESPRPSTLAVVAAPTSVRATRSLPPSVVPTDQAKRSTWLSASRNPVQLATRRSRLTLYEATTRWAPCHTVTSSTSGPVSSMTKGSPRPTEKRPASLMHLTAATYRDAWSRSRPVITSLSASPTLTKSRATGVDSPLPAAGSGPSIATRYSMPGACASTQACVTLTVAVRSAATATVPRA